MDDITRKALLRYKAGFDDDASPSNLDPPTDRTPGFDQNFAAAPANIPPSSAGPSETTQLNRVPLNAASNGNGLRKFKQTMPPPEQVGSMDQQVASNTAPAGPTPAPIAPAAKPAEQPTAAEKASQNLEAVHAQRPQAPGSNWAQRLGLAILSVTKMAPAANMVMHPKWSAEQAAYENTLADAEARQKEAVEAERGEAYSAQKQAQAESYKEVNDRRSAAEKDRAQAVKDRIAQQSSARNQKFLTDRLKGREADAAYQGENDPRPPNYEFIPDPDKPGYGFAVPPAWAPAPKELLPFLPGVKENDPISHQERKTATDAMNKFNLEGAKAENKPEPAAAAKQVFQATVSKIADRLPPNAMTDVKALTNAIRTDHRLTADEQNTALAYLTANPSPASQGSTATLRVEGMAGSREYPVINKNTQQLEYRSATDINANPGVYAPAGQGATAMGKEAVFQDLHYNIDTARKAIQAVDELDAPTRAALSYTLRHTDPRSAMQTFLTGTVGQALNPQQQEVVQSLALLAENAMALRSVAGMGQGSDDLRAAIMATIPSGKTPSKGYGLQQLQKFEQVVTRLEKGVPGMTPPAGSRGGAGGGGAVIPPAVQKALGGVGPGIHKLSDGSSWMKAADGTITPR